MPTHTCEYADCGFSTGRRADLVQHQRTHQPQGGGQGLLPFPCEHPGCGYRGKLQFHLRSHQQSHSSDRPHVCPEGCGYASKTSSGLRLHGRTAHGEGPVEQQQQLGQCPHCAFTGKPRALEEHVNAHQDIKPHACQACGFSTAYLSHLRSHAKKCTGAPRGRKPLLIPHLAMEEAARQQQQQQQEQLPGEL